MTRYPLRTLVITRRLAIGLVVVSMMIGTAAKARAQAPPASAGSPGPPAAASERPTPGESRAAAAEDQSGATPQSAMRGYLTACAAGDYARAAQYLDLRPLPAARRAAGPELARKLSVVLDRTLWVDVEGLSDDPQGEADDGLPPGRDLVGTITAPSGEVDVLVDHVGGEGEPAWKIAAPTVRQIPMLYRDFGYGRLTEMLPAPFFRIRFLHVELWQWAGLAVIMLAAAALAWLATEILVGGTRLLLARARAAFDGAQLRLAVGPVRLLVAALVFAAGVLALGLPVPARRAAVGFGETLAGVGAIWLLLRLIDVMMRAAERRFVAEGKRGAAGMVPLGRRTVKVVLVAIATIAMLQNFGFNVTGVLAALGVGGLAVALAAQKTVENLFGGITLITDQPVRVGDFCRFGDRIGTVEDIGLRSTRVRTLDRTLVSVPNGEFAGMQLENFTRRDRIWLHETLGLRYETTAEQLRRVLARLKALLVEHPKIVADGARVRFIAFGAYSLDLEIFAYVDTPDYNEFLAVREEILLRIMDTVAACGTAFAFPSRTIYTRPDTGIGAEAQPDGGRGPA